MEARRSVYSRREMGFEERCGWPIQLASSGSGRLYICTRRATPRRRLSCMQLPPLTTTPSRAGQSLNFPGLRRRKPVLAQTRPRSTTNEVPTWSHRTTPSDSLGTYEPSAPEKWNPKASDHHRLPTAGKLRVPSL